MEKSGNNWTLGELVSLPKTKRVLKTSGSSTYVQYIGSRYICIREESDTQRGILLKVMGKCYSDQIRIIDGEPFMRDDLEEVFVGDNYFSYPFPRKKDVIEVLDILRGNDELLRKFEKASMHINPNSTYWVSDTTRSMLLKKKAQVFNANANELSTASDDKAHYRLSIVCFYKGKLIW